MFKFSTGKLLLLAIVGIIHAFAMGCYYKVGEELYPEICDTLNVRYTKSIAPLVQNNCFPCHDIQAQPSGIILQGYENIKLKIDDGKLECAINHGSGCSPMPKDSPKLTDCQIRLIEIWIENGAPNN